MIAGLAVYTGIVGTRHGWNLLPIFFGDIAALTWPGQFNPDFLCLLLLSALWLAWRNHFSAGGIVLGLLGLVGGTVVLAPDPLHAGMTARGDLREVLPGRRRASTGVGAASAVRRGARCAGQPTTTSVISICGARSV
jgi:hypothetical protein